MGCQTDGELPVQTLTPEVQALASKARGAVSDIKKVNPTTLGKTQREAVEAIPEASTPERFADLTSRTRGTVTWDEAFKTAQQLGWSEEKIMNLPLGKALNDSEMMATRAISKNADDTVEIMQQRLTTLEKGTPF